MPFLLPFLNQIKHDSALHILSKQQTERSIPVPFEGMKQSLLQAREQTIHMGETVNIHGHSGSGKTLVLSRIASYTVDQGSDVICLDMDGRIKHPRLNSDRFHLFAATPDNLAYTMLRLNQWLRDHANRHVVWLMIDGAVINDTAWDRLKTLQATWGFGILTASRPCHDRSDYSSARSHWDIRFDMFKENSNIQMRLASSHQEAFTVL